MPAIDVVGVSKRFRLYHEKYQSLKERVIHFGRIPYEDFWALRDVNLEIAQGSTFGLLGHNGSGKSTLLKCIAGILRPTDGEIHTRGRMAAMLELGAGFHPDLTGRENVYMNAAILGFREKEIDAKFDDIVAFAEIEQFIDQQVKHYSSGMYVRLGFAVAVHMDPEILLVDEVLAVGDEAFQHKCIARVREFQREGRTILIVTHNIDLVPQICDRAAVLAHGELLTVDAPPEAVRALRENLFEGGRAHEFDLPSDEELRAPVEVTAVEITDDVVSGGPASIRVHHRAADRVEDPGLEVTVQDAEGVELFRVDSRAVGAALGSLEGEGVVTVVLQQVPLRDGEYTVTARFAPGDRGAQATLRVVGGGPDTGRVNVPVEVESARIEASH